MPNHSTPTLKLSDLARIQVGQSFRKSVLEDPDSPYYVLQTRDLLSGGRIAGKLMRMSVLNEKPKPNVDPGDVIVLSRGVRFNAGVVCELPGPTTAQSMFHIIKLKSRADILAEYLASFLNTGPAQDFLKSLAKGATVQHLKVDDLGSVRIPVPPLETQRAFCALAEAVHEESRLLEELKSLRKQQLYATLGSL